MKSKASSDFIYFACSKINHPCIQCRYYIQYILVLCIRKIFTVSGIRRRLTERYKETFSIVSIQIILFLLHRLARENQNILSRFKSYNLLILCTKTLKQIILCQNPYNTLFCAKIPRTNYCIMCQNPYNKLFCAKIPIINCSVPKSI